MPLIFLNNVSIAYGVHDLLSNTSFQLNPGEKVGLVGRNGEGKSTLMQIIAGTVHADNGEVWRQPGLKIGCLEQSPNLDSEATVYDVVASGLGELGNWITQYHHLLETMDDKKDSLKQLGVIQHKLESNNWWHFSQRVTDIITKLDLPTNAKIGSLSGGWKVQVALARTLVTEPDVLLLDEPTNHLDFTRISWLEDQILAFRGGVLFITHDRTFLQNIATRIVDLDRGKLTSWATSYTNYVQHKTAKLEDEANKNTEFDKKLAKQEIWLKQGIKARRTRNEGRVRRLKKLREERAQRRDLPGITKLNLYKSEASGKKLIEALSVNFSYTNKPIIKNFSSLIQRGDKIGLLGENGVGKSTLLKLLLKQIEPDSGSVTQGTKIQLAYFDQLREQLDPEVSVIDSVADGSEFLEIGGVKKHTMSYLTDFLFTPERAMSPVKSLSGGEKNRLLLARLFTKSANLIIMDEPTNDLDLETIEMLEEKLVNYRGTLLLVSHDREFLDNIVTSVLVFEGQGVVNEYIGGYTQWHLLVEQREKQKTNQQPNKALKPSKPKPDSKKISFKEQKELAKLPKLIEQLETSQTKLAKQLSEPDFYQKNQDTIKKTSEQLQAIQSKLENAYKRWGELDKLTD